MRVLRAALVTALCATASACGYTWGIEHVPVIGRPGPGSGWLRVASGSAVYDVDVHLPREAPRTPPLLIVLHGYGGTGPGMERRTSFNRVADSAGFVVAYPNGQKNAQGKRAWGGQSDLGMLRALIDSVARRVPVDRSRVYLSGFSNGGMFTYRAAIAMPSTFAAIGVVAGSLNGAGEPSGATASNHEGTVPLVAVHGMQDHTVPYETRGNAGGRLGAPGSVRAWALRNGCGGTPAIDTLPRSGAIRAAYGGCRNGAAAMLYSMPDGGHGWPTPGTREAPLATSEILWRFFSEHGANDTLVLRDGRP